MTTVVNLRDEPYDVYIGRPSKWGNPFKINKEADRQEVLKQYKDWVLVQPGLMRCLEDLRGKKLGCFCKPKQCHGDVLVELVEGK